MTQTDEHVCSCPAAGFCPVFLRDMGESGRAICRGIGITPQKRSRYIANWQALAKGGGPGTELTKIFHALGAVPRPSCQCAARALQMDGWGVAGCREHREEILAWLRDAYATITWATAIIAGCSLLATSWFEHRDPFGSILDEAIRRAEFSSEVPRESAS